MSTGPSFLPFLEAANALWPLSLDDLRAIERARNVSRPLREAAEATIFLKDQIGERYSGNEMQAALVKLAVRLASIEGLQPKGVQGQIRSAAAIARSATRKPRRFLSPRTVVVVLVAAIAIVLITVALAVARVPLPGDWDDIVRRIFSSQSSNSRQETSALQNRIAAPSEDPLPQQDQPWSPAPDTAQERQPLEGGSSDGAPQTRRSPSPSPSKKGTQNRPVTPKQEDEERRQTPIRAPAEKDKKEKLKKD